jgi:hypothetical protein
MQWTSRSLGAQKKGKETSEKAAHPREQHSYYKNVKLSNNPTVTL